MAKAKEQDSEETNSIDDLIGKINKAAGRDIAYLVGKSNGEFSVDRFSSRVLAVDIAIGGGYPIGRNTFLFGPKSSCKSTLMYLAMAELTSIYKDRYVYLEDSENALDRDYAKNLGVNIDKLIGVRTFTAEEAFNVIRGCLITGKISAVFIDSLSALQPKKLVEGNNDDNVMGGIGRLTSVNLSNMEKDKFYCNSKFKYMPTVFYTSQVRKKVGLVFGNPSVSSGGESPDFYASVKLDLNCGEQIVEDDVVIGGKFSFVVSKNKTYPPYKRGEFVMINDGNNPAYISNESTLLDLAVSAGIIKKSGSWYSMDGKNIAQGTLNTIKVIENMEVEYKNRILDLCMGALYPKMKLAFKFREEGDTDDIGRVISTEVKSEQESEVESEQDGEGVC